jgi:hypothetical protein
MGRCLRIAVLGLLAIAGGTGVFPAQADDEIHVKVPAGPTFSRLVTLSSIGALEQLAHDSPAHYRVVQEVLSGLRQHAASDIPLWIQTTFDARDVEFRTLLLVTNPPKRQLAFTLDYTRYVALVTLADDSWQLAPAE